MWKSVSKAISKKKKSEETEEEEEEVEEKDEDEKEETEKDEKDEKEEVDAEEAKPLPTKQEMMAELCFSENLSDVHFVCKNKKAEEVRIPAHRAILGGNNEVFKAMLYPIQFSSDNKTAKILTTPIEKDIPIDEDADAFKKMLTCIYTDNVEMEADDITALLPLAQKYQVEALRLRCVEFMENDVNADNVCQLFEQGRKMLNEAHFGMKFIEENTADVVESKAFLDLSVESIKTILKSNKLGINEADLFAALENWAAAECKRQNLKVTGPNKRTVMGDAINYIRFPEMTTQEIAASVTSSNILSSDELISLFAYSSASEDEKPKIKWPTKPRDGGACFKKSVLLSPQLQKVLAGYYSKGKKSQWERCYHAKTDGYVPSTFHSKCDSVGPTISIIKATGTGYIFGGYTEQSWSSTSNYKVDPKAFIFSMVNRINKPVKYTINNSTYAIYADNSYGPTFGSGFNICVQSSMQSTSNYCSANDCYRPESGGTYNYNDLFGGAYNYSVEDIEVYRLKKNNSSSV
eukprot:TRINITY_DN1_c0_g1_i4.p1 TRINITY_DN1_c0_g1~~TRINITY_DN1_c0_g1_i4.p1  ORF type:complete len:545 (-),score=172.28 TRINITY_DN1_c0_g1_i4:219-1778(-)